MSIGQNLASAGVGRKDNFVGVPYVFGENTILAHLNTNYYHVHGKPFVYPAQDSVELTSGSGSWSDTGAITEVVPADTLTDSAFDLHWINIYNISANAEGRIDIFSGLVGEEILISGTKLNRNAVQSQEGAKRIQIPQQVAGTRISCRLSDGNSGTISCKVSFEGHYYTS